MIKIGEGETSEVFRMENGKVVKLFKEDMFERDDFDSEYRIAKYIGDTTDYAPKVHETVLIEGRHGYIMDEVQGQLFQDEIDSNPSRLEYYASQLGQAHRKLHTKEITDELLELSRCKDFLGSFLNRNTVFSEEVNSWLSELLNGLPTELTLLHSDFMPYNIMLELGELKVLDWAEPSLGPSILDVVRTVNYIIDPTDYSESIMTKESKSFVKAYLNAYYSGETINKKEFHNAFLVNSATEVAWAERSGQTDSYSDRLKSLIIRNYESNECEYLNEIENL